jgi:hypothetical protein
VWRRSTRRFSDRPSCPLGSEIPLCDPPSSAFRYYSSPIPAIHPRRTYDDATTYLRPSLTHARKKHGATITIKHRAHAPAQPRPLPLPLRPTSERNDLPREFQLDPFSFSLFGLGFGSSQSTLFPSAKTTSSLLPPFELLQINDSGGECTLPLLAQRVGSPCLGARTLGTGQVEGDLGRREWQWRACHTVHYPSSPPFMRLLGIANTGD